MEGAEGSVMPSADNSVSADAREVDTKGNWVVGTRSNRRDAAERLYQQVSPNARRILDYWMDNPGIRSTGEEIAQAVGLRTKDEVNGSLSSIGTRCKQLGRPHPFKYWEQPDGNGEFWMEPNMAEIFREARGS